jgi:hypothetical protein
MKLLKGIVLDKSKVNKVSFDNLSNISRHFKIKSRNKSSKIIKFFEIAVF